MTVKKGDRPQADAMRLSQMTPEDQLCAFLAWLPADLRYAPGIDWTRLPGQAAGYLVRSVGASPDAAYLAVAAAAAMDALRPASLLSMLYALRSLVRTLREICEVQDLSDLRHEHAWYNGATRTPMPKLYSGQLKAYACIAQKHFPAYLKRLSAEERQLMSRYALPPLPSNFLRQDGMKPTTASAWVKPGGTRAQRQQQQQQKKQLARAYIREQCQQNPDVTCQELRELLTRKGIRMGNKSVNTIRRELGQQRPSRSGAQRLRSSRVDAQARAWLVQQRSQNPDVRVHVLQAGLCESFGLDIGTHQLNTILRVLGVSRPGPHHSTRTSEPKTSAVHVEAPAQPDEQTGAAASSMQLITPRNRRPPWTKLQAAALPDIRQRLAVGETLGTIASDHRVSIYAIRAILYGRNWNPGEEELKRIRAERRNARRVRRIGQGQKAHRTTKRGGYLPQNEVGGTNGDGNQDRMQERDTVNSTFGRWLEQTRFERGMNLASLAGQTGVDVTTISRLERGKGQVTLMMALRLCEGLQVSLAALGNIFLETISPELKDAGNRASQHILTVCDLLAYLDYYRREWHKGRLLLVDALNRCLSTHSTLTNITGQAVREVPLYFGTGDVEKLSTRVPSPSPALLDLPHLERAALRDLVRVGGVVTFPDVGAYLKYLRLTDGLTLQSLQQAVAIPFTVLGRLEQGVIERVKLATAIALDRQWRQEGRVLALFWSATHYAHAVSASTERERNLLACFVRACRGLQQDPHAEAWLVHLRETINGTSVSKP